MRNLRHSLREKIVIIDDIEEITMNINGFKYTESEVLDALRIKGYLILDYRTYNENHVHGSTFTKDWYDTKVAIKGEQLPEDKHIWTNVALREFQNKIVKPKLI